MSRRQFGNVRKLPSGRYQARYRDPNGRQQTDTFGTKGDASRWLAKVQTNIDRGAWHDPQLGRLTFSDWADRWLPTTVNLRASTRARDESYLSNLIRPTFDKLPLSAITHMDVSAWVASLSAEGRAPATVVKASQIMAKIMRKAVADGRLVTSPCDGVALPRIERVEMRFLTPDEIVRLVEAMDPRYRALVLLGAYGGLRAGELLGLRASRVDLLRGRVHVAATTVEVGGRLLLDQQPKTKASNRSVPLPSVVLEALADHLTKYTRGPDDYVFSAPEGGPIRLASWRSRYWTRAINEAGLAPLRIHDLRHTAVSLWIAAGANPKDIAARAGHTSVSVVLDRYGHLYDDAHTPVNEALDAMARAASPAPTASVVPLVLAASGTDVARPTVQRHAGSKGTNKPAGQTGWALRGSNPRPLPCKGDDS